MNLQKFSYSLLFCLVSITGIVNGQDVQMATPKEVGLSSDRLSRIAPVFDKYVTDEKMAGSVILIGRKGKVAYFQAFGYRDKEAGSPMKRDAIFRIASQSKAIISVGIMMLQEQGKLLIQDPVGKYIPQFNRTTVAEPAEDGTYTVVEAKRPITLRDLLTHTSGIGYGYGPGAEKWSEAGIQGWYFADRDEPISKTIERMASLPMDAQPGAKWVYGYSLDILGVVIERASGMPLDKFLQANIFDPLGMKDTQFYLDKGKSNRLATVYTPKEGQSLVPAPAEGTMNSQGAYITGPRKSFSGGAGLLSTAADYYRFLQMMENEGELNGKRLLAPSTVRLMTSSHLSDDIDYGSGKGFGLGFEIVLDKGQTGRPGEVGAFGWGGAYGSTYWVDPAEDLVVVYFTQLRPGSIVKDQLMLRALVYQAITEE